MLGRKVNIREQETNKGLAKSIVDGVTELCQEYSRAIVLEDDILVGTYFLRYMNDALEKYKDEENVYQISGYMFPVEHKTKRDSHWCSHRCSHWCSHWRWCRCNRCHLVSPSVVTGVVTGETVSATVVGTRDEKGTAIPIAAAASTCT